MCSKGGEEPEVSEKLARGARGDMAVHRALRRFKWPEQNRELRLNIAVTSQQARQMGVPKVHKVGRYTASRNGEFHD